MKSLIEPLHPHHNFVQVFLDSAFVELMLRVKRMDKFKFLSLMFLNRLKGRGVEAVQSKLEDKLRGRVGLI